MGIGSATLVGMSFEVASFRLCVYQRRNPKPNVLIRSLTASLFPAPVLFWPGICICDQRKRHFMSWLFPVCPPLAGASLSKRKSPRSELVRFDYGVSLPTWPNIRALLTAITNSESSWIQFFQRLEPVAFFPSPIYDPLRTGRILPTALFPGLTSSPLHVRPFRFALEPHMDQHALMQSFFWTFILSDQKGGRKVTNETT